MQEIIKQIIKDRQQKTKKLSESLATLEEQLHEAVRLGNTRKANSIRNIINRLKNKKAPSL